MNECFEARDNRLRDWVSIRRPLSKAAVETMTAHYVRQSFKPHAHDEYVIGIIEDGVHSVWCKGRHHQVTSGTVVTMHPGNVHHGGAGMAAGWKQRMVYISEREIRRFTRDVADSDKSLVMEFGRTFHHEPALAKCFAHFHEVLHTSTLALARDVAFDALLGAVTGVLSPSVFDRQHSAFPDRRIGNAIDYLNAHVDDDVTLDELCVVAGLRRRQTIEAFKRITGLSPHAYHLIQKVKAVKVMLRTGMLPAEAAAQAGFSDQSHMTRHFVAIVGMTPGAYAQASR